MEAFDDEARVERMMGVIAAEEAISVQTAHLSRQIVGVVGEMLNTEVTTTINEEVTAAMGDELTTALAEEATAVFAEEVTSIMAEEATTALAEEVTSAIATEVSTALVEAGMVSIFDEAAVLFGAAVLDEAVGGIMGYFHLTYSAYRGISKEGTGKKALLRTALILISGIIGGFLGSTLGDYLGEYLETALPDSFFVGYAVTVLSICGAVLGKVSAIICSNPLVDKYLR